MDTDTKPEELPKSVTVQEYNDLQIDAMKQHLFIINTMIQKILELEKAVAKLQKS